MNVPPTQNHRILIAYNGARFHGWQVQPGDETIQGLLEARLAELYGTRIILHGSGRTDAGVHAEGQVAHFFAPPRIPPDRLPLALNARLPQDVRVLAARSAPPGFHARKSATGKRYRYQVVNARILSPFQAPFCHHERRPLDISAMTRAAGFLAGTHDFTSFCAHVEGEEDRVRTIRSFRLIRRGSLIVLRVEANGFLHHMVRNLAGTLLEVGLSQRQAEDIPRLLAAKDRKQAGPTAPPQGLFLERVFYGRPRLG